MLTVIIPVIVAFIASGSTYLAIRYKSSGKIATSEAAVLWAESQAMRKELRDEVVELRKQISLAQEYIAKLQEERTIDKAKIAELLEKIKNLEMRVKDLEGRI